MRSRLDSSFGQLQLLAKRRVAGGLYLVILPSERGVGAAPAGAAETLRVMTLNI